MTVSDPSTYHGGGVSHASGDAQASMEGSSSSSSSTSSNSPSIFSQILADATSSFETSSPKSSESLITSAKELASNSTESFKGALKEVGGQSSSSSSFSEGDDSNSNSSGKEDGKRPLNEEERRGLYVLGLIVAGGWIAGGLAKPSSKDHGSHNAVNDGGITTAPGNTLSGGKGSSGKAVIEAKAVGSLVGASSESFGSSGAGMVGGAQRKV